MGSSASPVVSAAPSQSTVCSPWSQHPRPLSLSQALLTLPSVLRCCRAGHLGKGRGDAEGDGGVREGLGVPWQEKRSLSPEHGEGVEADGETDRQTRRKS